jgi:nitrate reductase gamma subunit
MAGTGLMSKLDVAKEEIAYAKLLLGALFVADTSLISWLLSNATQSSALRMAGCGVAIAAITVGALLMHRIIDRRIRRLEDL